MAEGVRGAGLLSLPLLLGALGGCTPAQPPERAGAGPGDTIHVAPPSGDPVLDRTSIQAAFDSVRPGATVLLSPGIYLLGSGAVLRVPEVTVLGHPGGTVLRGCDPEAFEGADPVELVFGCTGLYLQANRQAVRDLTFEYTWHGIVVGPFPATAEEAEALGMEGPPPYLSEGHRIEGNTFRATPNGLRVLGTGSETSVVRDNDFVDVFHAIGIYGAPLHFVDNRVVVEEPGRVPYSLHPGSAVLVAPGHTDCSGHVVAGNRIEGYPDAIHVMADPGESCRGVLILDNTVRVGRVRVPRSWGPYNLDGGDSTMVGVPLTLRGTPAPPGGGPGGAANGILEEILVEGNRFLGAEGVGIVVEGVVRSRIVGNTVADVGPRTPFPGLTWEGGTPGWGEWNGAGIWLSPGSDGNEIAGNLFEGVAGPSVVIGGDDNRVALTGAGDELLDLGRSNRVAREGEP